VRLLDSLIVLAFAPVAAAQSSPSAALTEAQQIASAMLPLPAEFRDNATVLGYRADSPKLVTLRRGSGPFTCLASDPAAARFHIACYHHSLEPFMARGRALRGQGITGEKVDTVRFAEVKAGKLAMPKQPAALYSLTGPAGSFDPATNTIKGARPLFVIYIAGATSASTGLSAKPQDGAPWIMFAGTPKAHIMLVPKM
jgi:hypothetical protein